MSFYSYDRASRASFRNTLVAWGCIALQLLPPISGIVFATSANAETQSEHMLPSLGTPENSTNLQVQPADAPSAFESQLAGTASQLGTSLSGEHSQTASDAVGNLSASAASNAVNNTVSGWLSQFGTVQSNISFDNNFSLQDSSIDVLVPVYDSPKNMLFTQLGARNKDHRNTINIGLGWRTFFADHWMAGINAFYDDDLSGHNRRLGVGGELWTDYLQLSANTYQRLNSWHQSSDFDDYDERPANGFDIRANAFLPSYPQLGGKLVFEQYFGDQVALIDTDTLQKNPYAVTVGINYTPIPLLTVGLDEKLGKSGENDTSVNLQLTYRIGSSWEDNTSPGAVDALRSLPQSRYSLVNRNNNIVLEYKKQDLIKLMLSTSNVTGEGGSTQPVSVQVNSKYGVEQVNWTGASFYQAGGMVTPTSPTTFSLTLPPYVAAPVAAGRASLDAARVANTYVLTAIAEDSNGNKSSPSDLVVQVLPPLAHFNGDPLIVGNNAAPDGKTPINVTFNVMDSHQTSLPNKQVNVLTTYADSTTQKTVQTSDKLGNVTVDVTSVVTGAATVLATLPGDSQTAKINFALQQPDAAHSSMTATPANFIANGTATSLVALTLHDANDQPITGRTDVTFSATGTAAAKLAFGTVTEKTPGVYTASLTGTQAGNATIASSVAGNTLAGVTTDVTLTSDQTNAQIQNGNLTIIQNNAKADGVSQNSVKVLVTDNHGQPVGGQVVEFSATNSATIDTSGNNKTATDGTLTMTLTSQTVGISKVTATANGSSQTVDTTFVVGEVNIALTTVDNHALADGIDKNSVKAVITDKFGQPVGGQVVVFAADNGAVIDTSENNQTAADGTLLMTLTSKRSGNSQVSATVNDDHGYVDSTFEADSNTAEIADGNLKTVTNNSVADDVAKNTVEVLVTDRYGNPVPDKVVVFSATNGATIDTSNNNKTGADGKLTMPLTSPIAGVSKVTALVDGAGLEVDSTFIADASTAQIADSNMHVNNSGSLANGIDTNSVTVTVKDAKGNVVPNANVTFTVSTGATIIEPQPMKTDESGFAIVTLSSTQPGTYTVTATAAVGTPPTRDVTFVPDPDTP